MLMRALSVHIAHEIAGAARIRHSLRPLFSKRVKIDVNLGHPLPREYAPYARLSAAAIEASALRA
jgi:hypothetical protein